MSNHTLSPQKVDSPVAQFIVHINYEGDLLGRLYTRTLSQAIRLGQWVCEEDPKAWFDIPQPYVSGNMFRTDILIGPLEGWKRVKRLRP